ncbi:ribosome silencing factor [Holzapfeliella sp. He02]|uniref:Ribosomal silencing factor RsfS n=1 Tax=Holzapfeliella saturejae TaxID=3082953 RepID=A0ABU8SGX2_9LACO
MKDSKQILDLVVEAIDNKHGEQTVALDMKESSVMADYLVISQANSHRQLQAIVDEVVEESKKQDVEILQVEGEKNSEWFLIDLYDVIVNVFLPDAREFYGLEKLFADAKLVNLD